MLGLWVVIMNRRKKGNQILKKRAKRAKAKLAPEKDGEHYISKAERAKMEAEAAQNVEGTAPVTDVVES